MKVLGIIPARGGSKGIKLKNIQKLAGKPLITYSIQAATKSKQFDKIIVSTDNKKIANIAKNSGAEVPFLRPRKISQDNTSIIDVVRHVIHRLKIEQNYVPDIIVILQPTSPLRSVSTIKNSINMLKKSNATCILAVSKIKTHPYSSFYLIDGNLKPFKINFEKYSQRQDRPTLYHPTGSIYTFWYDTLRKYDSLYGPRTKPIIADEDDVDIDSKFDLFISEMILLHWKKYKKFYNN